MRGKRAPKRKIQVDPIFNSTNVAKFVNYIMERGKKSVAQKIVYDCFNIVKEKTKEDPLDVFDKAIKNIAPEVEVKGRRVGGANYQVPISVSGDRRTALAYRWLITAAKDRKGMPMKKKLAMEIIDASNKMGAAFKKRENTYKMAEANRAFAHFSRH